MAGRVLRRNAWTNAKYEIEYEVLCNASKEALFMRVVLAFLQTELTRIRTNVFGGNKGAKAIADDSCSVARSKHIDGKLDLFSRVDSSGGSSCLVRGDGGATCRRPHEALTEEISFYWSAEL